MVRNVLPMLLLLVLALSAPSARAGWPSIGLGRQGPRCCPDDYAAKKLPPIPCKPGCAGPCDYDRKKLPPIPCRVDSDCTDDYCRKMRPLVLPICYGRLYNSGPSSAYPR